MQSKMTSIKFSFSSFAVIILFFFIVWAQTVSSYSYERPLLTVSIVDVHFNHQIYVPRIANNRFLRSGANARNYQWQVFERSDNPAIAMYGMQNGAEWYFIENVDGGFRLIQSQYPSGNITGNDPRWIHQYVSQQDGSLKFKSLATGKYMRVLNNRVTDTPNPELATNLVVYKL